LKSSKKSQHASLKSEGMGKEFQRQEEDAHINQVIYETSGGDL
jgi:hypothetical protein